MKLRDNIYVAAAIDTLVGLVLALVVALVVSVVFSSCSRKVVCVPAESVSARTDTVTRVVERVRTDTLRERVEVLDVRYDSVAPILDSLDRVIGWERWHWRESSRMADTERAHLLAVVDSLSRARTDSVTVREPYAVEVVREVERKRPWWETALASLGALCIISAGVIGVGMVRRKFGK